MKVEWSDYLLGIAVGHFLVAVMDARWRTMRTLILFGIAFFVAALIAAIIERLRTRNATYEIHNAEEFKAAWSSMKNGDTLKIASDYSGGDAE